MATSDVVGGSVSVVSEPTAALVFGAGVLFLGKALRARRRELDLD